MHRFGIYYLELTNNIFWYILSENIMIKLVMFISFVYDVFIIRDIIGTFVLTDISFNSLFIFHLIT